MVEHDVTGATLPRSYWITPAAPLSYPALDRDIRVDVAVIGGGLVGITTAYLLKQERISVAVIEAGRLGEGTTGHTTAKITSQHHLIYDQLIRCHGREKAQQYAQANEQAIAFMEDLVNRKMIACDFSKQSAYIYTQEDQYIARLEREVEAAASLGIPAHFQEHLPLPLEIKGAERFDNQAQFHPYRYLSALAGEIPGGDCQIYEQTRAVDFRRGSPFTVITAGGQRVTAEEVVLATHFPIYDHGGYYPVRIYPDRSYAIAITAQELFPGGIYISAETPGRSLRSTPFDGGELIIIVGEHHRTGQGPPTGRYFHNLTRFAEQTFTVTGRPYCWSAQDYITLDEVPYVGRFSADSGNVYVATGFRKWGITNGTAAAILLRDLILHGENPWEAVYDPARFRPDPGIKKTITAGIALGRSIAESGPRDIPGGVEPAPGESAVLTGSEGALGLFRDEGGHLHRVDLTCTHLGCQPAWNEAERSWDCPCHGSRFTYRGELIEGPALMPLGQGGGEPAEMDPALQEPGQALPRTGRKGTLAASEPVRED